MKRELEGKVKGTIPSKNSPTRVPKPDLPNIDIAAIGASAFHRHVRRKDTEVFMTSLHEIDRIIQEKTAPLDDDEKEVLEKLPSQYHDWKDVFSKKASDTLPPDRHCNHKIELESGVSPTNVIGHSPLYKQSVDELEAAKNT